MTLKILLVACSALAGCGASAAKPMTFACSFVEKRGPAFDDNRFESVDRVTVDFDAPSLHFAVSDTMGSAVPVDWTYKKGPPPFAGWPEERVTMSVDGDGTIHATAMRWYTMFTFAITKTDLVATAVSEKGVVSQARFRCTRS